MVNVLTDDFPESICIGNKKYAINYDYRDCLLIMMAFEDCELTIIEKQVILLNNLFVESVLDTDVAEALEKGIEFLNCGEKSENKNGIRLYSFSHDAKFILAAFQQTHGIDLRKTTMHWWQFIALFMDLGKDTTFSSLVALRQRIKTGNATKEDRAIAAELGDILSVPDSDNGTIEEMESEREFMRAVEGQQ